MQCTNLSNLSVLNFVDSWIGPQRINNISLVIFLESALKNKQMICFSVKDSYLPRHTYRQIMILALHINQESLGPHKAHS